ncbi:MAG: glycosyltransferase family 2 protein [Myxococcota bacterium]|nr:glycosyltransferase family 2 protein [Myxococcota bacterium]
MSPAETRVRLGVAIAAHNSWGVLEPCLRCLEASVLEADLHVVVFDDGSTDGTRGLLSEHFPSVEVIRGDGDFWWTGGTNRAVERCLQEGCDYVLLLNPDVFVSPEAIANLIATSQAQGEAVCASLVVDRDDPDRVIWAGSSWRPVLSGLPVWTSRYLHRRGASVETLPAEPYETSEVHGRAVLFPAQVLRRFGLHDDHALPHYGADTDYSLHIGQAGVPMFVVPAARASLDTTTTGLGAAHGDAATWRLEGAARRYWRHLTDRKSGRQLYTLWTISRRHVPWYGVVPTYAFGLSVGSLRFWQREVRRARAQKHGGGDP